jgi:hypothetical protein
MHGMLQALNVRIGPSRRARSAAASLAAHGLLSGEERSMKANTAADGISSWLEREYCASVAATLLARNEYFELLEDAMVSPVRLVQARNAWREHLDHTAALGGLWGPRVAAGELEEGLTRPGSTPRLDA